MDTRLKSMLVVSLGFLITSVLSSSVIIYQSAYHFFPERPTQLSIESDALVNHLKDAETDQRGFIISNQDEFLHPYTEALLEIERSLTTLRSVAPDDPRVLAIEDLTHRKLTEMARKIEARRNGVPPIMISIVEGKMIMDKIRALNARIIVDEDHKVVKRTVVQAVASTLVIGIGVAILCFIVYVKMT